MAINIAILGFGTVGSGVAETLDINKDVIAKRVGEEIVVKHILDIRDFPESRFAALVTHNADDVFTDKDTPSVPYLQVSALLLQIKSSSPQRDLSFSRSQGTITAAICSKLQ